MNDDLVIPIYIDTNALLDLLASIEGGFSVVEKVTTRSADASGIDRGVKAETGTEFGIPNVLSLLKIKLGYSANWKKAQEESHEREAERYHTYGSLFHRLRAYLETEKAIKRLDKDGEVWDTIHSSDFVEVRGVVRPNPLADSLERIDRLIGMFQLLGFGPSMPTTKTGKKKARNEAKEINQIRQFFKGILSDIERENVRTFIIDLARPPEHRVVALLFTNYLRDQTMAEISHKEYCLFGKVVRKIEKDSDEVIELLRGTGLGGIGKEELKQLVETFNQAEGMNLPEVETEITGPALEVVPVAIFV